MSDNVELSSDGDYYPTGTRVIKVIFPWMKTRSGSSHWRIINNQELEISITAIKCRKLPLAVKDEQYFEKICKLFVLLYIIIELFFPQLFLRKSYKSNQSL